MNSPSRSASLPSVPALSAIWRPVSIWIWLAYVWLLLGAVPPLLTRYWFLDSMGRASIFWTNFGAQLLLFLLGVALFGCAILAPVRTYAVSLGLRRAAIHVAAWVGILGGWLWSTSYQEYLLAFHAGSFGETDPVFANDIGFYVFTLPAIGTTRALLTWLAVVAVIASLVARFDSLRTGGAFTDPKLKWTTKLGLHVTNGLNLAMFLLGVSLVGQTLLARYGLLFKDNADAGVRTGAAYLDITGFFSTLNMIQISVLVELGIMAIVGYCLDRIGKHCEWRRLNPADNARRFDLRSPIRAATGLLLLDLTFFCGVTLRNYLVVRPNEPTIQVPYIERHIAATNRGYRLDGIETVDWRPPKEPLSAEQLLASQTVRRAPLLAPWVSRLEEPPDVQHYERVQAAGSTLIYGPVLQIFEQEQQLRPYYKLISLDSVRYSVNGDKRIYASTVRELPSVGFSGPKQWLQHWGSAALMYTHGLGLVMSPTDELSEEGGPVYAAANIPPETVDPAFDVEPRIYFGEGAKDDYILTDVRHLKEFDYATDQSRRESVYTPDKSLGIPIDSVLKRLFLALDTGDFNRFLFSSFIDHERTRAHFFRTPVQRISTIAPFLFLDTNAYAFAADGRILWMVNALTSTKNYPYSFREVLGDKADERAIEPIPERIVNYAEDAVKVTIDAYTGETLFYKIADDPIINAWQSVYPDLFEPAAAMSEAVEDQLTYPLQWFHIQFDDIYKRYHQQHPIEFYNAEDLWDDADEVVGSIGRGLSEFGTNDQMTFSYEGYNIVVDPGDLPAEAGIGAPGDLQYAMLMPFTPEGARNLRSLVVALQDRGNYGRLLNLRVPQGEFFEGPEQADTVIDDDSQVNQQITLWVRHGSEVIRGHTLLLPVGGDLIYVEPLWISSLQNELPQIKLVSVVYRGRATMGTSLEQAITLLATSEADEQRANELPWFNEGKGQGE